MKLAGRVALVTGAGRGIGRATAVRLAALGADVVISDVNLDSARDVDEPLSAATVADEVRALGRRCIALQADATRKDAVESMLGQVLKEFGRIDILVNNVGGGQREKGSHIQGESLSVSREEFIDGIDFNLLGSMHCCQAAAPHMVRQQWGRIVNVSSIHGLLVRPHDDLSFAARSTYGVAKAGMIQYTRVLAAELGRHGIWVNCIAPAAIATGRVRMFSKKGEMLSDERMRDCPLGRAGVPEDVAKVVEFLCTDLSDYVTGQCIRVDGGRTLF